LDDDSIGFEILAASESLRLIDAGRDSRRSIADAIDVLRNLPGFSEGMQATVMVRPLPLADGNRTGLIQLVCEAQGFAVSLHSAAHFRAIRTCAFDPEPFEIGLLDGARVDSAGNVTLTCGTHLHKVEVAPTFIPIELTPAEERIVVWTIRCFHPRKRCFRSLPNPRILRPLRRRTGAVWLDYGTLPSLTLPALKEIEYALKDMHGFGDCSRQPIANALARAGIRPRRTRRSRKRA
jgi:hypothetical protein